MIQDLLLITLTMEAQTTNATCQSLLAGTSIQYTNILIYFVFTIRKFELTEAVVQEILCRNYV